MTESDFYTWQVREIAKFARWSKIISILVGRKAGDVLWKEAQRIREMEYPKEENE